MNKADDLLNLKDRIDEIRTRMNKAIGKLETAVLSAKEEFGTDDVKKLQKLLADKEESKQQLDQKIKELENQLEDLLEEIENEE